MIPSLVAGDGPWDVLPPGIHDATLKEVEACFATNPRRVALFEGLSRACAALRAAGCTTIYIDGSFVTAKELPGDFDACWDPVGVNPNELDPVFLDFTNARANQKAKYGGELFLSSAQADGKHAFVDFFQVNKESGGSKGIIRVHLSDESEGEKHDNE